jgi:hypothetical protein
MTTDFAVDVVAAEELARLGRHLGAPREAGIDGEVLLDALRQRRLVALALERMQGGSALASPDRVDPLHRFDNRRSARAQ